MRVGIKIMYPSAEEYLDKVAGSLDFIEAMAIWGQDYGFLRKYGLPVIIHNMHYTWKVNFVSPAKEEINRKSLEFSMKLAGEFNSKCIIVHPEREEEGSSETQLVKFLMEFPRDRIILESMPYFADGMKFYAYDRQTMKRILDRTGMGMCLDFAHTSEAAIDLGIEPLSHVRDMNTLNPVHYHISDTHLGTGKDEHLHLGEGNMPLGEYKKLISRTSWVTLETPHDDPEKTKNDVRFLKG